MGNAGLSGHGQNLMADVTVTIATTAAIALNPHIDDAVIAAYIESRLNDARNTFITSMGSGPSYSAPGQYPHQQSGRLAGSVDTQMSGEREGQLFSDLDYAAYLTDGTTHMAPRRMLGDAMDEVMAARPETDELAKAVVITESTSYD